VGHGVPIDFLALCATHKMPPLPIRHAGLRWFTPGDNTPRWVTCRSFTTTPPWRKTSPGGAVDAGTDTSRAELPSELPHTDRPNPRAAQGPESLQHLDIAVGDSWSATTAVGISRRAWPATTHRRSTARQTPRTKQPPTSRKHSGLRRPDLARTRGRPAARRALICLKRIYNCLCSMLVYTLFALCFVTLRGVFMHFPELTY
jgi:hypothetical protein